MVDHPSLLRLPRVLSVYGFFPIGQYEWLLRLIPANTAPTTEKISEHMHFAANVLCQIT